MSELWGDDHWDYSRIDEQGQFAVVGRFVLFIITAFFILVLIILGAWKLIEIL